MQNVTVAKMVSLRGKASLTAIFLLFGPPLSTVIEMARVIAKVIVGGRSHVDHDGFLHHGCCHFGTWEDVTVIPHFEPPLSTVREVARVVAKIVVRGRSHVDYDGFLHHGCCHFGAWGVVTLSTVKGVARVIAKVIVGDSSHVDFHGFFHHGCCHFGAWGEVTVILLFFGSPLSTVRGLARVIAKVIVGVRSHLDFHCFVHYGCCHFGAWGKVTVILLFFGPPLSTVKGVARVIAKVIVGGPSLVDYDGFFHHGCFHFGVWGNVIVILLFFGPPLLTVKGVTRVIAKVIVGGRSHVDYDGFLHHGCCQFGAWGNVTVILLFFGPPLSTVRGVARVIVKIIVGGPSHVDYDGFFHHGCCHFGVWGNVIVILLFFGPPLSTMRGVARVTAKAIVGGGSHVDYDDFLHHGCRHFGAQGHVTLIVDA